MPAMWSDSSKKRMRRAALRAGLIRAEDSDVLTIILEPEAAVLHCLDNQAPPLLPGVLACLCILVWARLVNGSC
jgi:preprotein translocase subunit Sec61beta